ncbi:MAG: hypothetical protein JO048_09805 [Methylobacteriaceae bacterium]|nr:hypothetical protein [Methylobacteriaceae bacterium]
MTPRPRQPRGFEIPQSKLHSYLLNLDHRSGRGKALFFRGQGFHLAATEELAEALVAHAQSPFSACEESFGPFGRKLVYVGPMVTPSGKTPVVQTVWLEATPDAFALFVTAYPQ